MKLRLLLSLLLLLLWTGTSVAETPRPPSVERFSPSTRTFRFNYNFSVKDIPSVTKRLPVWVPVAQNDSHQRVRVLSVKAPGKTHMNREPEYGNRMMYAEVQNPAPGSAEFAVEYEVTRRESSRGGYEELKRADHKPTAQP